MLDKRTTTTRLGYRTLLRPGHRTLTEQLESEYRARQWRERWPLLLVCGLTVALLYVAIWAHGAP